MKNLKKILTVIVVTILLFSCANNTTEKQNKTKNYLTVLKEYSNLGFQEFDMKEMGVNTAKFNYFIYKNKEIIDCNIIIQTMYDMHKSDSIQSVGHVYIQDHPVFKTTKF